MPVAVVVLVMVGDCGRAGDRGCGGGCVGEVSVSDRVCEGA